MPGLRQAPPPYRQFLAKFFQSLLPNRQSAVTLAVPSCCAVLVAYVLLYELHCPSILCLQTMLPIAVPIGSWRFPTDSLDETLAPFYSNHNIVWGPSFEVAEPGPPSELQSSINTYNCWCRHAYDWNAILTLLDELEDQLAAAQGFHFRGPETTSLPPSLSTDPPEAHALLCSEVLTDSIDQGESDSISDASSFPAATQDSISSFSNS